MHEIQIPTKAGEMVSLARLNFFLALIFMLSMVWCEEAGGENDVGCQHKSTFGRDYLGGANTTATGIPCQRWSDTQPHDHAFTHVGDHNHCRNPVGTNDQVWCFTLDPDHRAEQCSVPFCPPLKVLDFSLDNDWKPDVNKTFTHASVQKENFPSSFTICMAFMVEQWGVGQSSPLFLLLDMSKKQKQKMVIC